MSKTPKQADNRPLFKRMPKRVKALWDESHKMQRDRDRAEWAAGIAASRQRPLR